MIPNLVNLKILIGPILITIKIVLKKEILLKVAALNYQFHTTNEAANWLTKQLLEVYTMSREKFAFSQFQSREKNHASIYFYSWPISCSLSVWKSIQNWTKWVHSNQNINLIEISESIWQLCTMKGMIWILMNLSLIFGRRIFHGTKVNVGDAPFYVAIYHENITDLNCGGAILSRKSVRFSIGLHMSWWICCHRSWLRSLFHQCNRGEYWKICTCEDPWFARGGRGLHNLTGVCTSKIH